MRNCGIWEGPIGPIWKKSEKAVGKSNGPRVVAKVADIEAQRERSYIKDCEIGKVENLENEQSNLIENKSIGHRDLHQVKGISLSLKNLTNTTSPSPSRKVGEATLEDSISQIYPKRTLTERPKDVQKPGKRYCKDTYLRQLEAKKSRQLSGWQGRIEQYLQGNSFNRIRRDLFRLATAIILFYLVLFGYLIYRENVIHQGGEGKNQDVQAVYGNRG